MYMCSICVWLYMYAYVHAGIHTRTHTYSTDQMQGIRRTRFDCILNAFSAVDEHLYCWRRTRLSLATNTFSGERVYR